MKKQKAIVAVTGASGAGYTKILLDSFLTIESQIEEVAIVFSENAKFIWHDEVGEINLENRLFKIFQNNDFTAPFASGSSKWDVMIICPCSMGMVGRIANGISNDLISRTADVFLKERRKLILVPRETPLSYIHLKNLTEITLAGGIIYPANPSFYHKPESVNEMLKTVTDRILDVAGFSIVSKRWGE